MACIKWYNQYSKTEKRVGEDDAQCPAFQASRIASCIIGNPGILKNREV